MNTLSYKTVSANKASIKREWLIIDAENEVLGRLASKVAFLLRGKHKPDFTPHVNSGDNVIIINADKIKLTGQKWSAKTYISHSGYPGGQKFITAEALHVKKPTEVVFRAVKGMISKGRLGSTILRNLHVYAEDEHKHEAQKPRKVDLNSILS